MYLRFVVDDIHRDSLQEAGVFHAMWTLRDRGKLTTREDAEHDLICNWFNANLKKPTKFTASKPRHANKKNKAISWFKDTAFEHLARVKLLVAILQDHGSRFGC
jgi:hypothetical protein